MPRGLKGPNATSFGQKAGNPGNKTKPGSGRPPDVFIARLHTILHRNQTVKALETILSDAKHPAYMKALEFATDRVKGRVPQGMDVTSGGEKLGGVVILPPVEVPKDG